MSINSAMMMRSSRAQQNYITKQLTNPNGNCDSIKEIQQLNEKINILELHLAMLEKQLAMLESGNGAAVSRYNINMNPVASKLGADSGVDDVLAGLNMAKDADLVKDIDKANKLNEFIKEDSNADITKDLLFTAPRPIINDGNYTIEQLKNGDAADRRRYVAQYILADPSNQIRSLYALNEKMKYVLNPDYIEE